MKNALCIKQMSSVAFFKTYPLY